MCFLRYSIAMLSESMSLFINKNASSSSFTKAPLNYLSITSWSASKYSNFISASKFHKCSKISFHFESLWPFEIQIVSRDHGTYGTSVGASVVGNRYKRIANVNWISIWPFLQNLKGCKYLLSLPITISRLKCLRTLTLSSCLKLEKFSKSMKSLTMLILDGTTIRELPLSVELLTGLLLNLKDWQYLESLPSTINGLKSFKILNLSSCSKLENVPENLGKVESLEELDISRTAIRQLPTSIFLLKNLKAVDHYHLHHGICASLPIWCEGV